MPGDTVPVPAAARVEGRAGRRSRWAATALRLLAHLPLPVLHAIARPLAFVAMHVVAYRRTVVDDNLARAFPALGRPAIRALAGEFYRQLAEVLVETVKAAAIDVAALRARVVVTNPELLARFAAAEQSVVIVGGHEANWEWVFLACSATLPFAIDVVYKPLHARWADAFMKRVRSRFGARLITPDEALRELARGRSRLRAIALLVDQRPAAGNDAHWTTFFGQETAFLAGFEKLARLWGYPVVYAARRRTGRGRYEVSFEVLGEPPYEAAAPGAHPLVDRYAARLEASIRSQPAGWLWSHRRWRDERPFYD